MRSLARCCDTEAGGLPTSAASWLTESSRPISAHRIRIRVASASMRNTSTARSTWSGGSVRRHCWLSARTRREYAAVGDREPDDGARRPQASWLGAPAWLTVGREPSTRERAPAPTSTQPNSNRSSRGGEEIRQPGEVEGVVDDHPEQGAGSQGVDGAVTVWPGAGVLLWQGRRPRSAAVATVRWSGPSSEGAVGLVLVVTEWVLPRGLGRRSAAAPRGRDRWSPGRARRRPRPWRRCAAA